MLARPVDKAGYKGVNSRPAPLQGTKTLLLSSQP
jgi:hypothetical protein